MWYKYADNNSINIKLRMDIYKNDLVRNIEKIKKYYEDKKLDISSFNLDESKIRTLLEKYNYPNTSRVMTLINSSKYNSSENITNLMKKESYNIFKYFNRYFDLIFKSIGPSDHEMYSTVLKDKREIRYVYDGLSTYADQIEMINNRYSVGIDFDKYFIEALSSTTESMNKIYQVIYKSALSIDTYGIIIEIVPDPIYLDDNDSDNPYSVDTAHVYINGYSDDNPSFMILSDENNKYIIDDVLEGGDDDYFTDNNIQSVYFELINAIRNPNSSKKSKILTLYTARPSSDREFYLNTTHLPNNVFLTSKYDSAIGIAQDFRNRDVFKVRIDSRYLVNTLNSFDEKHYQVISNNSPIKSIELITTSQDL